MNPALLSSKKMDWPTPRSVVAKAAQILEIDEFDLDVAADFLNKKARFFYDERDDGLARPWSHLIGVEVAHTYVWCNPPYGRSIPAWVEKAASEAEAGRATTAMLIPARPDTRYFHRWIWNAEQGRPRTGVEVHFLPGRIKFEGAPDPAPFPSMIVIFHARFVPEVSA